MYVIVPTRSLWMSTSQTRAPVPCLRALTAAPHCFPQTHFTTSATCISQHPLQQSYNQPNIMNSFHTDSQSAVWSGGEDQTAAWSETDSASYDQDGIAFDWGVAGPVTVSTDPLRLQDMR